MKKKYRNIYMGARQSMAKFENDLELLMKSQNYRAPGEYRLTPEKFKTAVMQTHAELIKTISIAFMAQSVIDESSFLRNKLAKALKVIQDDFKKKTEKEKADKEAKEKAEKENPPVSKIQYLDKNGNEIKRQPIAEMRKQTPNLNRKQRRKLAKQKDNK